MREVHLVVLVVPDRAGDDERRSRLVDEHGVHFVDDREYVAALHTLVELHNHVVAQIVEAELVVRAVRDVVEIGLATVKRARLGIVDASDAEPQVSVDMAHPLRVTPGEIRVHRHQVRPFPGQRVEIQRQRRDERLALTGRHLRNAAEMQLNAAHELHIVRHHVPDELMAGDHHGRPEETATGDADRGERLGKDLVERLRDGRPQLSFDATPPIAAAKLHVDLLALGGVLGGPFAFPQR